MDVNHGTGWAHAPRIKLQRLQDRLGAWEGFRLPPVKSSGQGPALSVMRFPRWLFCPTCRKMERWSSDRETETSRNRDLPRCTNHRCEGSILVPMRYVAACGGGHLTDIDWWAWAHSRKSAAAGPCDRIHPDLEFRAESERGSSLDALIISCRLCGSNRSLSELQAPHALANIGNRVRETNHGNDRPKTSLHKTAGRAITQPNRRTFLASSRPWTYRALPSTQQIRSMKQWASF